MASFQFQFFSVTLYEGVAPQELTHGPHQPAYNGWTVSEWAIFYASFTIGSWAAYAYSNGRSQYSLLEWYAYFAAGEENTAMAWALWACGLS